MCIFTNDYITSPKKVGDKLDAGTYAFNDDRSVITGYVELVGFNPGTGIWKHFTKTVPNSSGWAGMPVITLTDEYVGTWTMHFDALDNYGNIICSIGPYTLTVNPVSVPITLEADRISITSGDWITFYGTYKPGVRVGIYSNKGYILTTVTNAAGNFMAGDVITISETSMQQLDIYACAEGFVSGVCPLLADKSNHIYINVYPKEIPPPPPVVEATHALAINLSPLSWANMSGLTAYLPVVSSEFAKAITLYGWLGWQVIESRMEDNKLVIYLMETAAVGSIGGYYIGGLTNKVRSLAWPTLAAIIAAVGAIAAIALRFGYLIVGFYIINLLTKAVEVSKTQADTEQIRTKTISDMCISGELTPEQCSEALKPPPEKGICETFGFSATACEQLKTGVLVVGGLIGVYILYSVVTPSKARG